MGGLHGAGKHRTIITNTDEPMFVTAADMYLSGPPSAANPWPSLMAFIDGEFQVSDLSIEIHGTDVTTPWTVYGIDPPIRALAHGVVILGTRAQASFVRVSLTSVLSPDAFCGANVGNGLMFEGALDDGSGRGLRRHRRRHPAGSGHAREEERAVAPDLSELRPPSGPAIPSNRVDFVDGESSVALCER